MVFLDSTHFNLSPTIFPDHIICPCTHNGWILKNGSWNGGVRDIMDGLADVGGAFFTASFIRTTVVDFTLPLVETTNTFFLQNPKASNQPLSVCPFRITNIFGGWGYHYSTPLIYIWRVWFPIVDLLFSKLLDLKPKQSLDLELENRLISKFFYLKIGHSNFRGPSTRGLR